MNVTDKILEKIRSAGWVVRVEQINGSTKLYADKPGEEPRTFSCQGDDVHALYHAACELAEMVGIELAG
jgi:hypothetical protein